MRAVPGRCARRRYGLGARQVTTSLRIVVPAAMSGIVAAVILGVSRAIGETMVVAVAAGGSGGAQFTPTRSSRARRSPRRWPHSQRVPTRSSAAAAAFQSLFFLGLLLFLVTFALNQFGDYFVRRTRLQY